MNKAADSATNAVFLTGLVRCGSSWAGRVLGAAAGTRYVYEPLNPKWAPRLRSHWHQFTYVRPDDEPPEPVARAAHAAFRGRQTARGLARAMYRGYLWSAVRPARHVLVKDPTACLAYAWLHRRFQPRMVLITRHPCGFASSIQLHEWHVSLRPLLRQRRLMADHLGPWEDLMRRAEGDVWMRLGAHWAAVHRVLVAGWSAQPGWPRVSYESLCAAPRQAFRRLAADCGLGWSDSMLGRTLSGSDGNLLDSGDTRRDPLHMADVWRDRLSPGQVDAVMGVVRAFGLDYGESGVTLAET